MTRDREVGGALSSTVRAWLAQPSRWSHLEAATGQVYWATGRDEDLYQDWPLEDAQRFARTIPDDDRQCVRVEGDLIRGSADDARPAPADEPKFS
jgi:hypothetical protein